MTRITAVCACLAVATLTVADSAAAQQGGTLRLPSPGQSEAIRTGGPQGFSVVLVLGDMQSASAQDDVPPAARKALADMKDFLPYKSYRLLDVQWTLCCGRSPVVSRLRGPDAREYELTLTTGSDIRPKLSIRFLLQESRESDAADAEVDVQIQKERQRVAEQVEALRKRAQQRYEVGMAPSPEQDKDLQEVQARLAELNIKLASERQRKVRAMAGGSAGRSIMDASFRMDVGETVVVGTSRVQGGDKALIALLTAVPPRSTPAK